MSFMGMVYADIELVNGDDLVMSRKLIIGEEEIRRFPLNILVDTGAYYLCINETIQEQLGLSVVEKRKGQLANGDIVEYDVAGPVEIRFQNRRCNIDAMILPGDAQPLLGAIPLEDLDVIIHPLRQELVVNPASPDMPLMMLK
jgi:clan AA aspartic protease